MATLAHPARTHPKRRREQMVRRGPDHRCEYQRRQVKADELPRSIPLFDVLAEKVEDQHVEQDVRNVVGRVHEPTGQQLPPHPGAAERIPLVIRQFGQLPRTEALARRRIDLDVGGKPGSNGRTAGNHGVDHLHGVNGNIDKNDGAYGCAGGPQPETAASLAVVVAIVNAHSVSLSQARVGPCCGCGGRSGRPPPSAVWRWLGHPPHSW